MYFLYKMPGKLPSKRTPLVREVASNIYIYIKYKNLLSNKYSELGENLTQGYFAVRKVVVTLAQLWKKVSKFS